MKFNWWKFISGALVASTVAGFAGIGFDEVVGGGGYIVSFAVGMAGGFLAAEWATR